MFWCTPSWYLTEPVRSPQSHYVLRQLIASWNLAEALQRDVERTLLYISVANSQNISIITL